MQVHGLLLLLAPRQTSLASVLYRRWWPSARGFCGQGETCESEDPGLAAFALPRWRKPLAAMAFGNGSANGWEIHRGIGS